MWAVGCRPGCAIGGSVRTIVDPEEHVRNRRLQLRRPHDQHPPRLRGDGRVPLRRGRLALPCDHLTEDALELPEPHAIWVALAAGEPFCDEQASRQSGGLAGHRV